MDGLGESAIWPALGGVLGTMAGWLCYRWAVKLSPMPGQEPANEIRRREAISSAVLGGLLTGGLAWAMLHLGCQQVEMVLPEPFWWQGRVIFHAVLLWLLLAATITDLRDYLIPDQITIPGVLIGVTAATLSGQLQMMHLWMDWNDPLAQLHGAYIPEWIRAHQHWHGLAWSLTGLTVGAGLTVLVRWSSAVILGRQALGFGDVTLMAMIGSFLGWQPTVCVFVLAPLCGIVLALGTWLITGRGFVPYGPYLAVATVLVLFTWRWIWEPLRLTFGDVKSLAILAAAAVGSLVFLLFLLRLYWSIPVEADRRTSEPRECDSPD